MKQILELKNQIRQEKDESHQKAKQIQYKNALIQLEKEFNMVVIRNTKLTLEMKDIKREGEILSIELIKVKNQSKESQKEVLELRSVLDSKEGYLQL